MKFARKTGYPSSGGRNRSCDSLRGKSDRRKPGTFIYRQKRRSRLTRYTGNSRRGMLVKVSRRLRVRAGICNIPCRTCHPCWRQSGFIDLTQPLTTSSKAERAVRALLRSLPPTAYKSPSSPSLPLSFSLSVFNRWFSPLICRAESAIDRLISSIEPDRPLLFQLLVRARDRNRLSVAKFRVHFS